MNILEQLAAHAKERVALAEQACPLEIIREKASRMEKGDGSFEKALKRPGLSFICECKKASPSRGVIAESFPYLQIAREYQEAGADAVSVLTESKWFLGSDRYLREIAETVSLPCLRKDFTVDEYMIYEAKLLGASAVLLICSTTGTSGTSVWIRKTAGACGSRSLRRYCLSPRAASKPPRMRRRFGRSAQMPFWWGRP